MDRFVSDPMHGQMFQVEVIQDGGADGTPTSSATWTYTVSSTSGEHLGRNVPVLRPRPNGGMIPAVGSGMAFYNGGQLCLFEVPEIWHAPKLDENGNRVLDDEGNVILRPHRDAPNE
jgi:hypothetical protein